MTARLTILSGRGPKEPAAFLIETQDRRILLDLGEGPEPGRRPDVSGVGAVDALLLSHAHKDHCGALDLRERIGSPPVYATRSVLDRIGGGFEGRALPIRGRIDVLGLSVETGRSGHALGGIWIRLEAAGGLLYMGDSAPASNVFASDPPPRSRTLIIDASYGVDEEGSLPQRADLLRMAQAVPLHLPVPPDGRGLEIGLFLSAAGISVAIDDAVRAALLRLAGPDREYGLAGTAEAAAKLAEHAPGADDMPSAGAILTADATGQSGMSAQLLSQLGARAVPDILFTGHLPKNSAGERLVSEGRAKFRRWNVHPTLSENAALVSAVRPARIVAAFGDQQLVSKWRTTFAPAAIITEPTVVL